MTEKKKNPSLLWTHQEQTVASTDKSLATPLHSRYHWKREVAGATGAEVGPGTQLASCMQTESDGRGRGGV